MLHQKILPLVLAAGRSSRLGQPKQLIADHQGRSLLEVVLTRAASACGQIPWCVLGHRAGEIQAVCSQQETRWMKNSRWEDGMGASIACGVEQLLLEEMEPSSSVLILTCDQYQVGERELSGLIGAARAAQTPIVASSFGDGYGPPVIFSRSYWGKLARLGGHQGAKKLIASHQHDLRLHSMPEAEVDLDTSLDLQQYKNHEQTRFTDL